MNSHCSEAAGEAGWHQTSNGRVRSLPNRGDGDCLFQAISHQLGGELLAPQLRQHAIDYMGQHLDEFAPQLLALAEDLVQSGEMPAAQLQHPELPAQVLNVLRLPWTWGGAECIAALARFLGRRIRVYLEEGPTIVFEPLQQEQGAAIRILHRFGGNGRRTHYESVLMWNPPAEQRQQAPVDDASNAVEVEQAAHGACSSPPPVRVQPERMSLRSRPLSEPLPPFRSENFSDEERLIEPIQQGRYRACRLCNERVGRYGLIPCGAFPTCGTCIRELFILSDDRMCTHCGQLVQGWSKVFNQN